MADNSELSAIIIDAADGARATLGNPFDIDYAVQLYRSFSPEQSAGLFVGVSEYFDPDGQPSGTLQGIEYAVDDAVDLAELFAFNLALVRPKNVVLALSGTPKKESSRAALAKLKAEGAKQHKAGFTTVLFLAQKIRNLAKADGLLVTSFATHGFASDGKDYLLCQDSLLDDVQITSLCVQDLLSRMQDPRASSSSRRLVLLDACREFLKKSRAIGSGEPSQTFAEAVANARGTVVLTGTVAGGFSYDDPKRKNGVFTATVRAGLLGEATTDHRGFITSETLADFLQVQVRKWIEENRPGAARQCTGISKILDGAAAMMPLAVDRAKHELWRREKELSTQPNKEELQHALDRFDLELELRAPVLREEFQGLRHKLIDAAEPLFAAAMGRVTAIAQEVLNIPFLSFARGKEPAPYSPRKVFPGAGAFSESDWEIFFGRDAIIKKLQQTLESHSLSAVIGRSGCGKTSLIQAGLLPALRQATPEMQYLRITPGSRPMEALQTALRQRVSMQPLLLFVDQIEEALNLAEPSFPPPTSFFDELLNLSSEIAPGIWIVIALREDCLPKFAAYPTFYAAIQASTVTLTAIEGQNLARAIEQQLAFGGYKLQPAALAQRIVREVQEHRSRMALVQIVLEQLERRRHGGLLVEEEYDHIGGIEGALALAAESIYAKQDKRGSELIKELFTRLIRLDPDDPAQDHWQPADADWALGNQRKRELLKQLEQVRLVVIEKGEIQLTNEKLIDSWLRLSSWRSDAHERPWMLLRQGVSLATREWKKRAMRDREAALEHRGEKLAEVLSFRLSDHLTLNEQQYLENCCEVRDQEKEQAADQRLRNLAEMGWGVIFPAVQPGSKEMLEQQQIIQCLRPLLELRRAQVKDPTYYKELSGTAGYRPDETKTQFLARFNVGSGVINPSKMPYYLLLVGDPEIIPFEFQYQLDIQYAVGRIHFDRLEDYASYARSVVKAEASDFPARERRAVLFSPERDGLRTSLMDTQLAVTKLIPALAERMSREQPKWRVQLVLKDEATKPRLSELLGGGDTPAFLFTAWAVHKLPNGDARQLAEQGALICQEWEGQEPASPEAYFAGTDLAPRRSLLGLITFFWSAYTAGTPRLDNFHEVRRDKTPQQVAPKAFVADLPKRLLSHPDGGALAVIGHVDVCWRNDYLETIDSFANVDFFANPLKRLLSGFPVGAALHYFNQRYVELMADLQGLIDQPDEANEAKRRQRVLIKTAAVDARNYVVIGDPAVRIKL